MQIAEIEATQRRRRPGRKSPVFVSAAPRKRRGYGAVFCALLLAYGVSAPAYAASNTLPTGGSVAAGNAAISQSGNTLNINQSTNSAIINWQSFSVGRDSIVNFNQPGASSSTLNRVLGTTPSWIAGQINAPGTVLLINPNGIVITKSGIVNTGGFAASSLNIKDSDYLSGSYTFTGTGNSAAVRNNGRINVSDGGFAALLGGQVANNGVISARLGKIGLGAGEMATLDLSGDGFLSVAVPSRALGNLVDKNGALVSNNGKILANGGQVFLSAAAAQDILRNAVNIPGEVRANSVGTHNGKIVINGGDGAVAVSGKLAANGGKTRNGGNVAVTGGSVQVSGKISANGKNGGAVTVAAGNDLQVAGQIAAKAWAGQGGRIDLSADNIALISALVDASGSDGGGLVRIGGTFQGGNGDPASELYSSFIGRFGALAAIGSAQTVSVDAGSIINVSARNTGDGGAAIVWSNQNTTFAGSILAMGGALGGNGGAVETSGKQHLQVLDSASVNALAPAGAAGNWLLDPKNIIIATGGSGTALTSDPYGTNATGTDTIAPLAITGAAANVTLQASTDITVSNAVTMASSVMLTLNAGRSILVNANITSKGGFTATIDDAGATVANRDAGQAAFTMAAGTLISTTPTTAGNGGAVSITTGTLAADDVHGATSLAANIGDITIAQIATTGLGGASVAGTGGNITITNSTGNILSATSGTVTITANAAAATSGTAVGKAGGAIAITATNGTIGNSSTSLGAISSTGGAGVGGNSSGGAGGAVTLITGSSMWVGSIVATGGGKAGNGTAGAATAASLQAPNGAIKMTTATVASAINWTGNSTLTLTNAGAIAINGAMSNASGTLVIAPAGNVTQTAAITASSLLLSSTTGNYTLTTSTNNVATFAASVGAGTVSFADSASFNIGSVGSTNGITSGALTLTSANGKTVSQSQAISATALTLAGTGSAYTLNAANSINTLAGTSTLNSLAFTNSKALTIGSGSNGLSATGAIAVAANGSTADITVSKAVSTTYSGSGNGITLTAGRDIKVNAAITANSATGNAVSLVAPRNISITQPINAQLGILALQAGSDANPGATITDIGSGSSAGMTVDRLVVTTAATNLANGPVVTLGNGGASVFDEVNTIAASVGSFTYYGFATTGSSPALTVGTIGSVSGITAHGTVSLSLSNDNLSIGAPVTTPGEFDLQIPTTTTSNGAISVGRFVLNAGSWTQLGPNLPSFSANDFIVGAQFLRATGGGGTAASPYTIVDVYGLQGAGTMPASSFKLASNIDATGTANWNGAAGFSPISSFSGTFDGGGFAIDGLTINQPNGSSIGLFSSIASSGTVKTLSLTNVDIIGGAYTGAVAATNNGTISNVSVSGTVKGTYTVGGLVGQNAVGATIIGSSSSAVIAGYDGSDGVNYTQYGGGLVGENDGTITGSSAGGNVSGYSILGGLVGYNTGTITASSASGSVSGPFIVEQNSNLGGLVGVNNGSIASSHASGNVTGGTTDGANRNYNFGGLAGLNIGSIASSYATGAVTGSDDVGGLVGANAGTDPSSGNLGAGTIAGSHASGTVRGFDSVGGLVGGNIGTGFVGGNFTTVAGTITDAYAAGQVTGQFRDGSSTANTNIGGLVGLNYGEIARSYAIGAVSGDSLVGGLIGNNRNGAVHEVFATGNVTATGQQIGGLIGVADGGSLTNAYATGAVSGQIVIGGLVGNNNIDLTNVYSTGAVTSSLGIAGALIGQYGGGTLTNAYWDSTIANGTPGFGDGSNPSGAQGLATSTLQSALPPGFDTNYWGSVPNNYPFLLFQPGVISGTVYTTYGGSTVGAGVTVSELLNGVGTVTAQTDASGHYVMFVSGVTPGSSELLTYTSSGVSYQQGVSAAALLNIYGTYLSQTTSGPSASTLATGFNTAVGGNAPVQTEIAGLNNRLLNLTGTSFVVDQALGAGTINTLVINATGAVTQTAAIAASKLALTGTGGSFTLTNSANQIGTLAANTGLLAVSDAAGLTVNTVAGINGITATGAVTLNSDSIALTAGTGTISAAGQNVTLAPDTAGTAIAVGSGGSGLVIGAATLALISADTLTIGNTLAGGITVNQSIAPNVTNLALVSGSGVTQTTGTITVSGLGVQGTTINLGGSTTATTFASSSISAPTINVTGDVTIGTIGPVSGITWTDATTATVKAVGNITVAAPISNSGGGSLVLYADTAANGTGTVTFTGNGAVNFGNNSGNISIYYHPAGYASPTDFTGSGGGPVYVTNGSGTFNAYMLVDSAADLQNINSNLSGTYALNRNIDLTGVNFTSISDGSSNWFGGLFDGQYHTISNLTMSGSGNLGLFGEIAGTVRNLALTGVNISGSNGSTAGGLAADLAGVVDQVYVTGRVSGSIAGGLVGFGIYGSTIGNVFTNVAVSTDGTYAGGIVGQLNGNAQFGVFSSISNSIAVGSVAGAGQMGGLVGGTSDSTVTVSNSYWDKSTTGQSTDLFASSTNGLTTASLQGTLPSGLSSSIWGTGSGLYPYLKGFFPTTPQAVSGIAYSDRGVTAVAGGTAVNVLVNGTSFGSIAAGANGYYYALGNFAAGTEIVSYTTGGNAGVTYQSSGAGNAGQNVYGGYLTTVSGASTLSSVAALSGTAVTLSGAAGLTNREYDLTAASFAIDQALSQTTGTLVFTSTGAVTQSAAITATGGGLALLGAGGAFSLTNASNKVSTLAANTGTVSINNGANALTIDTVAGTVGVTTTGSLTIADTGSVGQNQKISGNLALLGAGGAYTLANASNVIGTLAGNTGSVTLTNSSGTLSIGTVAGTIGLSTSGATTLSSNAMNIGAALAVGSGQTLTLKPATASTAIGLGSGGTLSLSQAALSNITATNLVIGSTATSGTITVTGSVSAPANVTNLSLISTGAISIASGNALSNGNSNGSITLQSDSNPTLSGTLSANSTSGTINLLPVTNSRTIGIGTATGTAMSLTAAKLGTISAASLVIGGPTMTGTITATKSSAITLSTITNLILETTAAISLSSSTTSLVNTVNGGSITLLSNATPTLTGTLKETGTNGTVAIGPIAPGTSMRLGSAGTGTIALTQAALNQITAATLLIGSTNTAAGQINMTAAVNIGSTTANTGISLPTGVSKLSIVTGGTLTVASGGSITDAAGSKTISLQGGNLALNGAVGASTDTVVLNTSGSAAQSAAITAANLLLLGTGGSYTLTTATNSVGTLAANTGSVNFAQNGALTIGSVNGTSGITASGAVTVASGANLTIASGAKVSGTAVTLSATGAFINSEGSDAVSASTRWLIYSSSPAADTFGGLNSNNTAIWNGTLATLPPASITASGNFYVFAFQPTLTFTSTGALTKTYGDDWTSQVSASSYSVSGVNQGVSGVYLADTASAVYGGAPSLTSTGSAATANVAGGPYAITASSGTLTALNGYTFAFVNNGTLTVNPATLTFTANTASRTYGDANPALSGSVTGFKNGQTAANFGGDTWTTTADANTNVGNYAITGGLTSAAPNYTFSQAAGNATALTINQATLTFTANTASRTYGDANPTLSGTVVGFKNGQTAATFGGDTWTTTADANTNVGNYAITGGLTSAAPNYTFAQAAGNATALTINQATLTFTANTASRTYGDANPTLSGTVVGFKNGQTAANFGGDTWTTTAGANTNVGNYAINGGLTSAAPNYTFSQAAGNASALTINQATLTFTANTASRTYGDANPTLSGTVVGFKNGQTAATFGGDIWTTTADANTNVGSYAITGGLTSAAPNYSFVQAAGNATALAVTPAVLTFIAALTPRDYGNNNPALAGTIAGFKNGQTAANFGGDTWTTTADANTNVGNYAINGGLTSAAPNYTITQAAGNATALTITQAALIFTAAPVSIAAGDGLPGLTGTITGSKLGQTAHDFGGDTWVTPATQASPPGSYAINGGLNNPAPNYNITQPSSNATAFTIVGASGNNNTSHAAPPTLPPQTNTVNPPTLPPVSGPIPPIQVTFTPPRTSDNTNQQGGANPTTGALPDGTGLATNNGIVYQPVSQFDANQYSDFKLPDYAKDAGEAAIFTMIVRGADPQDAATSMINNFWNGTAGNWPVTGGLVDKISFSDGNGHTVVPGENPGFPITAGQTDFGALLKNGPVMISGGSPAHWLLATQMTQDGKGIVANDPVTGKQIELAWDPTTKTVGGVIGVFDPATKTFTALANAASGGQGISDLQGFTATNFLAVTVR